MTEPPRRYDVTITVDRDGGDHPNPAEFAVAAERVASARAVSIVSAHTASQIVSIVTVLAADQPAAVCRRPAVVSDALSGLLQNARPEGLSGDNRQSRVASRQESGEELPQRGPIWTLCGESFAAIRFCNNP
jgi:hypothetical protein